jgi:hypothetical protein
MLATVRVDWFEKVFRSGGFLVSESIFQKSYGMDALTLQHIDSAMMPI